VGAATPAAVLVSGQNASAAGLLQIAIALCEEAGGVLLERFAGDRERGVFSKSTLTDLVSEADLESERMIASRLAELRPDDGLLGEEGGDAEGRSGLRWIVDPLDGTINFLFGIPHWSVSVAVQDRGGVTIAGAVYDPCKQELWSASTDGVARLNGMPIEGSNGGELPTAMIATGLAYDARVRAAQATVLSALVPRVRDIRRFGSAALDLAWTATGRYDAYFERSVKVWDIAAGALICERAGLTITELPAKSPLPWGLLVAPPALGRSLLEIVG
jgi:myo-inositol-1(or 4)-monophosphatase